MTGFAQGQQIGFLIASQFTAQNDMMHFEPLVLRFPFALLAGIAISCQYIRFRIGIAVVDPFLLQPLVLKHCWIFECMRVKGSCFQYNGSDRQEGLYKADFSQMGIDFASHGR